MKQLNLVGKKEIIMEEVAKPEIEADEVLIKVEVCGICGSDIHSYKGEHPFVFPPIVLGHEYTGIVKEVGEDVSGIKIGDHVTSELVISCGECYNCRHGRYQICSDPKHLGNVKKNGAMAEYVKMKANRIHVLPKEITPFEGAMVEPASVGIHAIRKSNFKVGDTVLVIGGGVIGNLTAQALKIAGAKKVIMAEIMAGRIEKAKEVGLKNIVNPKETNLEEWIEENISKENLDLIFDCAGTEITINTAVEIARKGTQIMLLGVPAEKIPVNMALVQDKELEVVGSLQYVRDDFERAISFISNELFEVKTLISETYPMNDYEKAFAAAIDHSKMEKGLMKVILEIDHSK